MVSNERYCLKSFPYYKSNSRVDIRNHQKIFNGDGRCVRAAHKIQLFYYLICRYIVSAGRRRAGNVSVFTIYMRNPDRSQVRQCQHVTVTIAVTRHALSIESMRSGLRTPARGTALRGTTIQKGTLQHGNSFRCLAVSDRSLGISSFARKHI